MATPLTEETTDETSGFITVFQSTHPDRATVEEGLTENPDLENLLEEIHRNKLVFPYHSREVTFISKAIEALVLTIASDLVDHKGDIFGVQEDIEANTGDILCNIGSFYEHTKNTYPDQFDFVYVPFQTKPQTTSTGTSDALGPDRAVLMSRIELLLQQESLVYSDEDIGELKLISFVDQTGDVSTFRFLFTRSGGDPATRGLERTRHVHVDLIPGVRVTDPNLTENVHNYCPVSGFQDQILESASMQYLRLQYSPAVFCEAEVAFMLRVLSQKHLKVYRLLKYLINGRDDDLDLEDECFHTGDHSDFFTPSYAIKTAIVLHHYECVDQSEHVGGCIVGILKWFETKFAEPTVIQGESVHCIYQVHITDLTNQTLVLATGNKVLIKDAARCLDTLINDLLTYKQDELNYGTGMYSFAARMTECVKKYDLGKRPFVRMARQTCMAVQETGSCCYKLFIFTCVLLLGLGILYGIILYKQ